MSTQSPTAIVDPGNHATCVESSSANTSNPYEDVPSPFRSSGTGPSDEQGGILNMADLELLHNFSTSTCFTLSSNPVLKTLWRINVPQLGFSHDFVMRGILAVSALHLAHFRPERKDRYVAQAMRLHQSASHVATTLLPNVTQDNCSALYMFSILTCIFALASPRKPSDFLLVEETGIAEWLFLLRGTRFIADMAAQTLHSGSLGPMFTSGMRRDQLRTSDSNGEDHLAELQYLISRTATDEHTSYIYKISVEELRKSFAVASKCGPQTYELSDAFIWPYRVSEDYLRLLKQLAPEALAIFAYFCILLKRLDSHWWMTGWSTHLISRIYDLLDQEHRLWIRLPIEEIGWVPNQDRMMPT